MTTWLIVSGIVLVIVGFVLRTILMMLSSDATPSEGRVLQGRELLRQYKTLFPKSTLPLVMRSAMISGAVLLLVGVTCHLLRQG